MNRTSRLLVISVASAIAVVAWAQSTSNSNSSSNTRQGGGSASASGRASSSSSGNGSFNGGASASMAIPNYAVILNRNPRISPDQIGREFWEEEVAYWQQIANRGACTMAGNWREWDGGLVLLSVPDDQTAQNIANNDPGVKRGIFTATVRAWEVRVTATPSILPGGGALRGGSSQSGSTRGSSGGSQTGGGGGSVRSGGGR